MNETVELTLTAWQVKNSENVAGALKCELELLEVSGGKVKRIKCVVCAKFADRIRGMKGFSQTWVEGTESIKKDSLEKHIKGGPHQFAENLALKETLGA